MRDILLLHYRIFQHFYQRSLKIIAFDKKNFYFYLIAGFLNTLGNLLIISTAFAKVPLVLGWNFYNVLALYGTYRLTRGVYGFFIGANLMNFFQTIRKGNLDLLLIKPASAWFLLCFQKVELANLADLITGIGLLLYTSFYLAWSWLSLFLFLLFLPLVIVLIGCTHILISFTAFFSLRETILSFFEKLMNTTTRFPLRFANHTLQFILTWLLPFMFLSTIPIEILENRINVPFAFISASTLGILYIFLTHRVWQICLRRYSSASS